VKCYYHPGTDAVGTCSQCAKGACRECLEDVGGAMLCTGCLALHATAVKREDQMTAAKASSLLRLSLVFAALGLIVYGLFDAALVVGTLGDPGQRDFPVIPMALVLPPGGAYFFWGLFWGFYWVWNSVIKGAWRAVGSLGCFILVPLSLLACVIGVGLLSSAAMFYGIFGGAFYQWQKFHRIAYDRSTSKATLRDLCGLPAAS